MDANHLPLIAEETLRILIVDDSEDDAELMRLALEEEGYAVQAQRVDNLADLGRALERNWDLILCDYSLPRLATADVLRLLRERERAVPLVLVSGMVSDETVVRLMHGGVRHFVPKRNMRLLGPVVRRALECSRPLTPSSLPRAALAEEGAPDWRRIAPVLDQILTQARAGARRVAVVSFDVDRFQRINHGLGYEQGEKLLAAMGERMISLAGPAAWLGRIRGDEFLVALTDIDGRSDAEVRVAEMLARMRRPFRVAGIEINASFSVGVALFPEHGGDAASLLREAEAAMFEAKRRGRGLWHVASSSVRRSEGVRLEHELYRALERKQLRLEYQPQVELESGRLLGVEALLRWDHPDMGPVPPARFIPLAEESGEITRIGAWVLRTACTEAAAWRRLPGGEELRVAVNLSVRQFLSHDVVGLVRKTLDETGLTPAALDLELTESILISDAEEAANRLQLLRRMGVRTSVDDFGTGYSSLSYLRRFALDVLKIDRSFVTDLSRDARAGAVVSALIHLGQNLGMELIAEGVETEEQAQALRAVGCRMAQGFLFSRPVRPQQITAMLAGA